MKQQFLAGLLFAVCVTASDAQVSLATMGTAYTENFNTLPNATDGSALATWANNTTLTGWYIDEAAGGADDRPIIEATCGPTAGSVNNTGSSYIIASVSDRSLGSRPSGSTGTIYTGLRVVNNTGSTITSFYIRYIGEQWSIAENVNSGTCLPYCINSLNFDYQVGATSLTTGVWTNDPTLTFTQLHNCTLATCTASSNQRAALDGNAAGNRTIIAACVTVTVNNGQEIWFRWSDIDNGANDHHLQIDDLEVWPFNISCATILPVELTKFNGKQAGNATQLEWQTASETNCDYFIVERSTDGETFTEITRLNGHGTTSQYNDYVTYDYAPQEGVNYYRLKQVDYNGSVNYSNIVPVVFRLNPIDLEAFVFNSDQLQVNASGLADGNALVEITDLYGKVVLQQQVTVSEGRLMKQLSLDGLNTAVYFVRVSDGRQVYVGKFVR
jgi:hypothetical protein